MKSKIKVQTSAPVVGVTVPYTHSKTITWPLPLTRGAALYCRLQKDVFLRRKSPSELICAAIAQLILTVFDEFVHA